MGITTGNLGLYKPAVGEVSWGTLRNANEDVVDVALGTQHTVTGTHSFITVEGSTGYIQLPTLDTTERDALTPVNGTMIYNSSTVSIQSFEGGAWSNIALGSSQFTDAAFRINDDGDLTKQIAFQAAGITTGTVRTITMPDVDIDLGDVAANTVHAAGDGSDHADVATNTLKVTNANHTGDATGDAALTLASQAVEGQTPATVASLDEVLIADVDDSDNLKKVTAQSIADLGAGGGPIEVFDEGGSLTGTASSFDFVGAGVTATNIGSAVTVTIPGGGGYTDPMTTRGDVLIRNASNVTDRLAIGGANTVLTSDGTDVSWAAAAGGGATLELDVTQANAFSVTEWVYHNGTIYVLADAVAAASAESIGIITAATGADFTVQFGGRITGLSGLTAGEAHFLSDTTPGEITATSTTTEGSISKPVLVADSTTTGFIFNMRGSEVTSATLSFYKSFDNGDLVSDELPFAHNLGHKFAIIQVYDENDQIMIPDNVTLIDDDNALIDLTSSSPIAGTWRVVVLDAGTFTTATNTAFTLPFLDGAGLSVLVNHQLSTLYPIVQVYNELGEIIVPDDVNSTDANNTTIDLTSFGTRSGTWQAVIMSAGSTLISTASDLSIGGQAQGDVLYYNGTNWVSLPAGTAGQRLETQGAGSNPTWETNIEDDTVTVAMLADGTDGELITWDAAGEATTVAVGTAADVLTSNGVGAAPTFQTPAGGGAGAGIPVILRWGEIDTLLSTTSGEVNDNDLLINAPVIIEPTNLFVFWSFRTVSYTNVLQQDPVYWKKTSGINTVSGTFFLWERTGGAGGAPGRSITAKVTIGGQDSSEFISQSTTPTSKSWSVDVSSLTNGTSYEIEINGKDNNGGGNQTVGYFAKIIGFES